VYDCFIVYVKVNGLYSDKGNRELMPKWAMNGIEINFCPFCGTKVPQLQLKQPVPEGICKITDGGYYCGTCHQRLMNCKCHSPACAYEIKETK
jgi:hypothetical protein